jgi:hypothetical protein
VLVIKDLKFLWVEFYDAESMSEGLAHEVAGLLENLNLLLGLQLIPIPKF